MPEAAKQSIAVRLDARDLRIIDGVIERLAVENPHWPQVTRSDAIRAIIASSGSAAAPIASTAPPDPEKRRSG